MNARIGESDVTVENLLSDAADYWANSHNTEGESYWKRVLCLGAVLLALENGEYGNWPNRVELRLRSVVPGGLAELGLEGHDWKVIRRVLCASVVCNKRKAPEPTTFNVMASLVAQDGNYAFISVHGPKVEAA